MANTKVTGDLLADGTLFARHLNESHGITTSVIGEGTNLYYTNDRVSSYLSSNGYATSTAIIASIVDSAPSTLDTLNELAAALGDDPNFATTVTTAIATKVDGTGTASYLMKWSDSNTATNSVIYDDGTNVGLGVIPSGWGGSSKALQIGSRMSLYNDGFNNALFGNNTYFNGSDNYYINTAAAARFYIENTGKFIWNQAASGTAGNAISFTQAMTLNASGNLSIGTTSTHGNLTVEQTTGESGITVNSSIAEPPTVYLRDAGGAGYSRLLANNKLHIDASQVGIGTTSPIGKLSVEATGNHITLRAPGATAGKYWALDVTTANQFYLINNAGTQYLTITDGGNVGIGTASPSVKLDVTGASNVDSTARFSKTSEGSLLLGGNRSTSNCPFIGSENAYDFAIITNNTERMRIDSSGNVGIGTNDPLSILSDFSSSARGLAISNTYPFLALNDADGGKFFVGTQANIAYIWNSGTSSMIFGTNAAERMRIDSSGNVGIGTTSPQAPLHVIAASTNNDALIQEWSYNSSDQDKYSLMLKQTVTSGVVRYNFSMVNNNTAYNDVLVLDRGKVGIGTTSPAYKLTVGGDSDTRIQVDSTTTQGIFFTKSGANNGTLRVNSSGDYEFYTKDVSQAVVIKSGGNLGIGTTSPQGKLDVVGDISYAGSTNNSVFVVRNDGSFISGGGSGTSLIVQYGGQNIATLQNTGTGQRDAVLNMRDEGVVKVKIAANNSRGGETFFNGGGYFGIGTDNPQTSLQLGRVFGFLQDINSGYIECNRAANGTYIVSQYAARIHLDSALGEIKFSNAASGTAGTNVTLTERMRITSTGGLAIGTDSASGTYRLRAINSDAVQGNPLFAADNAVYNAILVYSVGADGYNGAATGIVTGKNTSTNRSINAGGTINASGSDYAEYITKAVEDIIAKGDIVGINNQAKLTNIFADAISFVVKSTDPSYVGGDAWFNSEKRPEKTEDQTQEEFDEIMLDFESRLEIARAKVDRIAFSGQVPCNVYDAQVGDYIIPVQTEDGKITGQPVSDPTFEQYTKAVGKVWKIMEDGRAWISVKIG